MFTLLLSPVSVWRILVWDNYEPPTEVDYSGNPIIPSSYYRPLIHLRGVRQYIILYVPGPGWVNTQASLAIPDQILVPFQQNQQIIWGLSGAQIAILSLWNHLYLTRQSGLTNAALPKDTTIDVTIPEGSILKGLKIVADLTNVGADGIGQSKMVTLLKHGDY